MLICDKKYNGDNFCSCDKKICCCECQSQDGCATMCSNSDDGQDESCLYVNYKDNDEISVLEYVAPTLVEKITKLERKKKKN